MRLGPYLLGPNDTPENGIYTGDAKELAKLIPDESIDLIFTDPPYPKEFISLYEWLAKTAARILKPGGLCLALCGHFAVLEIGNLMSAHLEFFWLGGMGNSAHNPAMWPRKMWAAWKPMWWFVKPGSTDKSWTLDFLTPSSWNKRYHKWGQPIDFSNYYIDRLTKPGEVVFDPFCGGGTNPASCYILNRKWLSFEINPAAAKLARQQVKDTELPLFAKQISLF